MAPVRRIAQIVHLKPSAVAAYKECHANVWPEVLQQIKDCNIKDCKAPVPLSSFVFDEITDDFPSLQTPYSSIMIVLYLPLLSTWVQISRAIWKRCGQIQK